MAPWVAVSAGNQESYYWNPETQATSWTPPQGEEVVWVSQKTASGNTFYRNTKTNQTSVDPPTDSQSQKPSLPAARRQRTNMVPEDQQQAFEEFRRKLRGNGVAPRTMLGMAPGGAQEDAAVEKENLPFDLDHIVGGSTKTRWSERQTPEGKFYNVDVEARSAKEPLSSWSSFLRNSEEDQKGLSQKRDPQTTSSDAASVPLERGATLIVHFLKQNATCGHGVCFQDGRMMVKMPGGMGNATLLSFGKGASFDLRATNSAKDDRGHMLAADHLTGINLVKHSDAGLQGVDALAKTDLWDVNLRQTQSMLKWNKELNFHFSDASGYGSQSSRHLPLNAAGVKKDMIGAFIPAFSPTRAPFVSAVEQAASFEQSSLSAASSRLRFMKSQAIVASSVRVSSGQMTSMNPWAPDVLAGTWMPYLRPKTLTEAYGQKQVLENARLARKAAAGDQPALGGPQAQQIQQMQMAQAMQQAQAQQAPAPDMNVVQVQYAPPPSADPQLAMARAQAFLVGQAKGAVLDILGSSDLADDMPLMHMGSTLIEPTIPNDALQETYPAPTFFLPEPDLDMTVMADATVTPTEQKKKEEKKAAGGLRASATRIRAPASSVSSPFFGLASTMFGGTNSISLTAPPVQSVIQDDLE